MRHQSFLPFIYLGLFLLFLTGNGRAASLEILPGSAMPESEVIARGAGYPAAAAVDFTLVDPISGASPPLGQLTAADNGRLFGRLMLPDVAPGSYRIHAETRGVVVASTVLEVLGAPALALSPTLGPPGQMVQVSFGPVEAGRVTIFYDDIVVRGPVLHPGGLFQAGFLVPADRPAPLGAPVTVRAELQVAGSIRATASAIFQSQKAEADAPVLISFIGPGEPLSPGEQFTFSGQVQVPSFRSPSDYQWTLAARDINGAMVPINLRPIVMDALGNFSGDAVMPSVVSGYGLVEFPETVEFGLVYLLPDGGNGFLEAVTIVYEPFEVQNLTFDVRRLDNNAPIENAVIEVSTNTLIVPPGYDYEEDGFPDFRVGSDVLQKPTWSAAYAPPNQYHDAIQQITQAIAQTSNPITGCPVTLLTGLTNSAGLWQTNAVPFLNWLLDKGAQSVSELDIDTTINGPGKAEFSVSVGGLHLNLGWLNNGGVCTGQRFDFQYDYDTDLWKLRSDPDGDFDTPFNPDLPFVVHLAECPPGTIGLPADPFMPNVPAKLVSQGKYRFGALWSFPDTNGAPLVVNENPEIRLPHKSSLFGGLDNPTLYIDDAEVGPLAVDGFSCSPGGVEYMIELPQLVTMPPGIYQGRIEAELFGGTPVMREFELDIRPGPTWINQAADFDTRVIQWWPNKVSLLASEPQREQVVNAANPGYGIGPLGNDNQSQADIIQLLLPSGAGSRKRSGDASSSAANQANDPVVNESSGSGSSPGNPVPFGSQTPVTVLDTGKIPLFRYTWGIPPIASASVGADVWFKALYAYFGETVMTNAQVLVDVTTQAIAQAGLDLWIDASIILDLVSLDASALPNFELTMPLVVTANQLDAQASQPCFDFALDVAWAVQIGWCPFCIKHGATDALFHILEPQNCAARSAARRAGLPQIPPIDRTSLAVDGTGLASVVWGDGSGALQFQSYQNGVPAALQALTVGPGAMGAAHAYWDSGKAVLVWAQSSLSESEFLALDGDPNDPLDGDYTSALAAQHLVYRVNDGSGWSSTMPLTLPSGGDGGVVLAACPASDPACPAGGEVLAVWVHDASGNLNLHDLKLQYAFFDGLNWSPVSDMDPASTAKDLQPAATYLNGDPVVFWVRNPSVSNDGTTATFDLNQRRLVYRFLRQSAGVIEPAGLPMGVASPSVQAFGTNSMAVAFSKATEGGAFIGTRRSLHTLFATQCFSGVCQIGSASERTDSQGRRIFVERPKLTRNLAGQGVVTFRQLGVENADAADPAGVLQHTGALMQLVFDFVPGQTPAPGDPFELDNLGGVNWRVDSVFDPSSNSVLTTAVQVELAGQGGLRGTSKPGVRSTRIGTAGATLLLAERPMLPEFELLDAELAPHWIANGGTATLTVRLRNNGTDWAEAEPLTIATYWDGPPGVGLPGPTQLLTDLPAGQPQTVQLAPSLPPGYDEDQTHTLHVVVNPRLALEESDASNNEQRLVVGALPPPTGLSALDGDASGNIIIHWEAVNDPRVTGYRVYRRNPDGSVLHVGASNVPGFADFSAYPEQRYEYYVTSLSARLNESVPSQSVPAWTLDPDRLFKDNFESLPTSR